MNIMIHAHTAYSSDGELSPAQLASLARRHGFDAVLVSDHFESLREETFANLVAECRAVSDCLLIPGYERSFGGYHILALGVGAWFDDRNILRWCDNVRSAGGIAAVAHPVRYSHRIPAPILEAVDAVEVWNSKFAYDGGFGPNPRAYRLLGRNRYPLCGQDLHGVRHVCPVGVQITRWCGTEAEIFSCLKQGRYWMTNGVISYGADLSNASHQLLSAYHGARRPTVEAAIGLRRWWQKVGSHD